jgi:hypothetical protein
VRATGGSIPWFGFGAASAMGLEDGVGPVLEGDSDRARSALHQHVMLLSGLHLV